MNAHDGFRINTYSTHLCISDKYTHLRKHNAGKETEVVDFWDEEQEQEHPFHATWEADMNASELPSLSLIFLLTPTSYLSRQISQTPQTFINPSSSSSRPTWISRANLPPLPPRAREAQRAAGTRFVCSSSSPLTHVVNQLSISFILPRPVRADGELS